MFEKRDQDARFMQRSKKNLHTETYDMKLGRLSNGMALNV